MIVSEGNFSHFDKFSSIILYKHNLLCYRLGEEKVFSTDSLNQFVFLHSDEKHMVLTSIELYSYILNIHLLRLHSHHDY